MSRIRALDRTQPRLLLRLGWHRPVFGPNEVDQIYLANPCYIIIWLMPPVATTFWSERRRTRDSGHHRKKGSLWLISGRVTLVVASRRRLG